MSDIGHPNSNIHSLSYFSDEIKFYRNSETVPAAQYKIIDICESNIEIDILSTDKEDGICENINDNLQVKNNRIQLDNEDNKVIDNEVLVTNNSNNLYVNSHTTNINEQKIENACSAELQKNESLLEEDCSIVSQECDQTKSEPYIDKMSDNFEGIRDESSRIHDNQVDIKSRFYFGDAIPTLVHFSCQTFQDCCTKGCSWSPNGNGHIFYFE